MAGMPPKKGEAFSFTIPGLVSQADTDIFQVNPTLAAGDVKVFKDGGSGVNIGTLPSAIDAGAELRVTLSAAEMGADDILTRFLDVAGNEWCSAGIMIFTAAAQIGDIPTAAEIWAHTPRTPTTSAASVASALEGSTITVLRGDTLSVTLEDLGSIADRDMLWLTMKNSKEDADSAAIIQVEETAGLIYLNGAGATAGDGSLVVDDQDAGDITFTLKSAAAADLVKRSLYYDVQVRRAVTGLVNTLTEADAVVTLDVTRAIA